MNAAATAAPTSGAKPATMTGGRRRHRRQTRRNRRQTRRHRRQSHRRQRK
jgi:hypothetical protein